MAMRSILEGHTEPNYPEQIAKMILKTLGVPDAEAHAMRIQSSRASVRGSYFVNE
jgi:hypothetical protein